MHVYVCVHARVCVCAIYARVSQIRFNIATYRVICKVSLVHQEREHLLMKQQLTLKDGNKLRIRADGCTSNMPVVCVHPACFYAFVCLSMRVSMYVCA